jgi:hypothetical protein
MRKTENEAALANALVDGGAPIGMVETFKPGYIEGWVEADESHFPIQVVVYVNELPVANTWADEASRHNTQRTIRGFRILMKDVWQFCQRTDKVTVRISGQPIPIALKGTYKIPGKNGSRTLKELKESFVQGYVFSQVGRFQLSKKLDTQWQANVLELYARVRKVLLDKCQYDPFVIYGTLLGLVREKSFIGHDIDFDSAYVSRHVDGASAAAELRDIALKLVDAGFDVDCKRTALHIHDSSIPKIKVDLFDLYFDRQGTLCFPFGVAGTTAFTTADWQGLKDSRLAGRSVRIPANALKMVECIYGASWRTPIAGFNWRRARTAWAKEAWTLPEYSEEVYWANFYARAEMEAGSTFYDSLIGRSDLPATVVDIGCGDGRDTFAFAKAEMRAFGVDRSSIAIKHAKQKAADTFPNGRLSFSVVDIADSDAIDNVFRQARSRANKKPLLFYMRFILHSIPQATQDNLMVAIAKSALSGDMLAAEFRTDKDADNPKTYGGHYRRYQNGAKFGKALREQYGFSVLHEVESSGLSPYRDEDPVLYRVIASKQARNYKGSS